MEFKELVFKRRSVRLFDSEKKISDEDLQEIIEAGINAPSGVNLQPWYFVVVRTEESMLKLRGIMQPVADGFEPILKKRFPTHPEVVEETTTFIGKLGYAPVCILAFLTKEDYGLGGNNESMIQSTAAAIENMLLMATDKGLAGCWMTAPIEAGKGPAIKEIFAPDKGPLIAIVPIGYAKDGKVPKAPARKDGRYIFV